MHCIRRLQDKRRAQRFRVRLPVELQSGMAMTRDVSTCGMFFETTQTFFPGQCLQLTLVLEHIDPGRQVRLQCRGRVVRIEPCDTGVGIAVDITAYRLDPRVYDGGGC